MQYKNSDFKLMSFAVALSLACSASARADNFYIEIDYMVGGTPNHSHQPSNAVVNAVIQMFACQGHTLTIDVDDALPHIAALARNPSNCNQSLFTYNGTNSYGAIKAANFDHAADPEPWHYCIFAHQYEDTTCTASGSSGLADGGENFVVTLGTFGSGNQIGTPFDQAATLAHEFGHNLGLSHCGAMVCPTNNDNGDPAWVGPFVPNMPSVMSYRYQLAGVDSNLLCNGMNFDETLFKNMDYSHGRMCSLNESNLNEISGTQMMSVDWDCDNNLEAGVSQDLGGGNGGWCGTVGNLTSLNDYNEWGNLVDGASFVDPGSSVERPEYVCISSQEWEQVQNEMALRRNLRQPTLATESCITGQNVYIGSLFFVEAGTCVLPYDDVQQAHDANPNGSRFYIKPGSYSEAGTLLTKPGIYYCNTGTAVME